MKLIRLSTAVCLSAGAIALHPAIVQAETVRFQCGESGPFEAVIKRDKAKLRLPSGKTETLLPVDSLVGKKFSDGRILLFVNGDDAWVEIDFVRVYDNCLVQDAAPTSTPTLSSAR